MATPTQASVARDVKEIDPANFVRKTGSKSIGSGTFGTCFLGHYRGIKVVIKEYNNRHKDAECNHLKLQQEAAYETRVIEKLGDNPGILLLFGVMLKQKPVSLVLQFYGDGMESTSLYKAARRREITEIDQWKAIICKISDALQHIHDRKLIHNDLKSNNVVLEKDVNLQVNPVIIDFGKSV